MQLNNNQHQNNDDMGAGDDQEDDGQGNAFIIFIYRWTKHSFIYQTSKTTSESWRTLLNGQKRLMVNHPDLSEIELKTILIIK